MKAYLVGVAAAATLAGAARAEPPPAAAFGRIPAIQQAAIAPNGQNIALLGGPPDDRSLTFAVVDQPGLKVLKLGDVETIGVRWAGDAYVLAKVAYWKQFDSKHNYHLERNIAVTPEGKAVSRLLDGDMDSQYMVDQPVAGVVGGANPRAIVLGLTMSAGAAQDSNTRMARKGEKDVFQRVLWSVDPANGRGARLELGDFDTQYWDVDLAGEARVRVEVDELTHRLNLHVRAKRAKTWTRMISDADEDSWGGYEGYSDPDDAVYLQSASGDAVQIVRRKLPDGAPEPVGRPVTGSTPTLIWDETRGTAVGVASGGERRQVEWLDAELGGIQGALARAFKDKTVELMGWSSDRSRYVVRVASASSPGVWYLFDRPKKELSPIGEEYPELKDASFGPTRWMPYKARDGLEIPAYLTLPPGPAQPGRKPPLIVLPHGGPAARDDDDFDWLTQFLATRGYAVLRPQFRGSAGFGRPFLLAGRGEWGGKVQTDLLDGVAALAAQGQVDTTRTCIVGWSFGGYAALAGASLHPEAYRCAASMAGISDLGLLIGESLRAYGAESASLRDLRRQLAEAGIEKLRATSPLRQASAVQAPVLLMHGDQDTTVPIEQSRLMAEALKAAGKPVDFVTFAGEDHYLLKSAPRTRMLETLGAFLAKNLPVNP